jgi:AraC-like DNA-binding protein
MLGGIYPMPTQNFLPEAFYTGYDRTYALAQNEDCFVYKMENETGEGMMTRHLVFPGIELLYNDFHMTTVHSEQNKPPYEDIMEINHCREGRFECEFADGGAAYLGAGDLAANMLTHTTRDSWFPLSHYHGISVLVDLRAAQDTLCQISQIFGSTPIDLYALRNRLCRGDNCFIIRATDAIQHIFSELYAAPSTIRSDYCKLKVLELLLFLNSADLPALREKRAYITRTQADIIRDIRAYLVEHLDQHITLPELSARFDIPLTTMKQNFKTVYGDTIGTYIQSYRMQKAMWLLQETDQNITEIATQVGYQNASKFSEVFRQFAGATPSEYRKIPRPIGAESVLSEWQKI